jgi:hypothetical protein
MPINTLKGITTKDGLLYRNSTLLGVFAADDAAQGAGYLYAERLVEALEKNPNLAEERIYLVKATKVSGETYFLYHGALFTQEQAQREASQASAIWSEIKYEVVHG